MKGLVATATSEYHNQYPPMFGIPELRQAVARHSETYTGIEVQWDKETLITVGATEAIAAAFLGILNRDDEVRIASRHTYTAFAQHLFDFAQHVVS